MRYPRRKVTDCAEIFAKDSKGRRCDAPGGEGREEHKADVVL